MKQYFAKYLPVEGEIKEGDAYMAPKGYIWEKASKDVVKGDSNLKKVKLFLCSRDIQVGDMAKEIHGNHEFLVEEIDNKHEGRPLLIYTSEIGKHSVWSEEYMKVVGEISPEAVWVKEGDEFDEDSLQRLGKNISMLFNWSDNPKDMRNCYVAIKCPTCKKFH